MTELDLSKYEGHTPGLWASVEWTDETPFPSGVMVAVQREGTHNGAGRICEMVAQGDGRYEQEVTTANARLIADAPLLLAEVKRLREELKVQREMHDVCLEIHTESDSCLQAEEKLEVLRQSHARLLAAIKADEKSKVELRAAVAEAEAL